MPILRLAYTTQFLLALLAIFVLWGEVGGQSHLDLMPWYLKLGLGVGAAFATVKATAAAVSHERSWNRGTLRWAGILLLLLIGCGLASYYFHVYGEQEEEQDDESVTSGLIHSLQSEPHHRFQVVGLGEQVNESHAIDAIAGCQQSSQIARQGRRIAGDDRNDAGPQFREALHNGLA